MIEKTYDTKVLTPNVLDTTKVPSPESDSISPDKGKESKMRSEIREVRGSFVFTFRGARLRFDTRKQAEVQWRLCNP